MKWPNLEVELHCGHWKVIISRHGSLISVESICRGQTLEIRQIRDTIVHKLSRSAYDIDGVSR